MGALLVPLYVVVSYKDATKNRLHARFFGGICGLEVGFELTFEDGLLMEGDAAEKLTERLSRFATGAACVSATAEVKT